MESITLIFYIVLLVYLRKLVRAVDDLSGCVPVVPYGVPDLPFADAPLSDLDGYGVGEFSEPCGEGCRVCGEGFEGSGSGDE